MKKLLIYLGHPAHFHIYKNSIPNWTASGFQIYILIKKKDVLEDLLKASHIEYFNILSKGRGNSNIAIYFGSIKRSIRLFFFCLKYKPDLLIGTSVENSFIGKILKIPIININEDDAAVVPNYACSSYPFATVILNPRVCNSGKWDEKALKHESYHELAYLHPNHFTSNKEVVEKYISTEKPYFIIRLAKLNAHHDKGKKGIDSQVVDRVIEILKPWGQVYITAERELEPEFESYRLKINPLDMHHVLAFSQIYIGDSQTMAAEAGVLGIPFIRFNDFVGKIGYLRELEDVYQLGYGIKTNEVDRLNKVLADLVSMPNRSQVYQERRKKMLSEKIDFAQFLTWFVESYPQSAEIIKENPEYQFRFGNFQDGISDKTQLSTRLTHNSTKFKLEKDFTPNAYRQLLLAIKDTGYATYAFEDWCEGRAQGRYVILRHDVDLKAAHSLRTAKIEAELGMRASYYFRVIPESNQPEVINAIADLGHEIGYHYEELSIFEGDLKKSIDHFEKQLIYFRQFYPLKTISMHGSPSSKYDNRDIWKSYNYRDYGIIGEPYFDFLSSNKLNEEHMYFTDTARMWDGAKYTVRDKSDVSLNSLSLRPDIHSTFDFIDWLKTNPAQEVLMITTHPQRWTDDKLEWWSELLMQRMKNVVKRMLYVNS